MMEMRRFILILAVAMVGMMLWQEWQRDYAPDKEVISATRDAAIPDAAPSIRPPPLLTVDGKSVRKEAEDIPEPQQLFTAPSHTAQENTLSGARRYIHVETDVLSARIDRRGGTLVDLVLNRYPVQKRDPDTLVHLLHRDAIGGTGEGFHIVQTGLLARQSPAPNHDDLYHSEDSHYSLGDDEVIDVDLHWQSQGIEVVKTLRFMRGSYQVQMNHRVTNHSTTDWEGSVYGQLQRTEPGSRDSLFIYTYTGAVLSTPDNRYQKLDFDDVRKKTIAVDAKNGWIAQLQHHFVAAMIPEDDTTLWHYYTRALPRTGGYLIGGLSPPRRVAVGAHEDLRQVFYLGPKLQKVLQPLAEGLELTVDYGFLWFIGKPLFWVLEWLHGITGNWGVAIVLLTVLIKLAFYRLSAAGYRSMALLRQVQPRILAMRQRYAGDRQRLNKAMMDMYKEERINPLGGCFPILIQIPVFIALYWVLLESVEMRQADFALWIDDLSSPDRFFVLPVLMGITMYVQQKLNPPPADPVQEKILSFLPLVFSVFFVFFPAGLVLYWVSNNILSIGQQWLITRSMENRSVPSVRQT